MIKLTNKEFDEFVSYIKQYYGINLIQKRNLLEGRLQGILSKKGFTSFSEYYEYVIKDKTGEAVVELLDKVTTNYTFFMREKNHFNFYRDTVLPYLERQYFAEKDLRVWCAGCSSGEEAYTLAMINNDYFSNSPIWDKRILATDISNEVLEAAVKGEYENEQLSMIPDIWKLNYFHKINSYQARVTDKIKNEVIFRRFNLMNKVFPFKKRFHVIFCRNVMIYFDNETKDQLVKRYYDNLEPGGYFFIGHSESLNGCTSSKFKYIMPSVYRKE
ncbi:MAG: protein-glutamate O-methyltransferase CheR [Bacillota bacterium]|nr:protein-glutamate O-methyltransferase CheR [Bacillota bacterium]